MSNQNSIDKLIKEYSHSLKFLPVMERQRILLEITEKVQSNLNNDLSFHSYLSSQGGKLHFLNNVLHANGFPVLKKLKKSYSLFKIFITSFLIFVTALFISLYVFFKSYLPLFNYNELDGSLALFGAKMVFEPAVETYFRNRHSYEGFRHGQDPLAYNVKSNINKNEFTRIHINAEEADLLVFSHAHPFFKFQCESSREDYDVGVNQGQLEIDLKGLSQCVFFLPPKTNTQINARRGIVNISGINQDLSIGLEVGFVSWKKETLARFKAISFEIEKGQIENRPTFSNPKGWLGKIQINNGDVRFR